MDLKDLTLNEKYELSLDKNTDKEILSELAKDKSDIGILNNIAQNENTSSETLDELFQDRETNFKNKIEDRLSKNPNTSEEVLDKIADNEKYVNNVAQNPSASSETLDKIASNTESNYTLEFVVNNQNTSAETLDKVFEKTEDKQILHDIGNHTNTNEDTLKNLSENKDEYISIPAERNLESKENEKEVSNDISTETKEDISSENVSNNEIQQEQKSEENSSLYDSLSSYMSENIDLMADSRESEIAFDRGLAEALDNLDKKDFNSLSDVINDVKEKLENENDRASDKLFEQEATSEKVVEGNKDDLAEFGNAVQDFKDLTNSEEAQAYKEEQLSPENTKAGELFEKRDELMEQLENPKDGTFEIEQQLESINEKISELSTDDLRDYNNSLSSEITQEMRTEQEAIQERSELGQKDNDLAEFGNAVQDFKDLTNSEEAQAYKEEVLTSENNNEIKTEISNDVESSADNLKMELAKEEFTSYAEQNLPENEREEFVNTMLEVNADSIKSQDTVEGVEKEINSSLETYQEVKAELEAEKNVDVSSETNLKQDVEIDKNVDSSSVNEKEVSSDLQSKDVPEAVSDKEASKEVEAEKNIDSNVNSDKEQNKQTEIDFATETGASR